MQSSTLWIADTEGSFMHETRVESDDQYHRTTLRYSTAYQDYLLALKFWTKLDVAQIIRLSIHLSPNNEEFLKMMKRYAKPNIHRHIDRIGTDFADDLWKRC